MVDNLNSLINVDLHIHTHASKKDKDLVKDGTIKNLPILLENLNHNKISLFSFTDHNCFDKEIFINAKSLLSVNKYENVKNIIPGCEFDVKIEKDKDVTHMLVFFDYCNNEENLTKIESGINAYKKFGENDFFTIEELDKLLSDIGLSTIIIGEQRKSFDFEPKYAKSISDSVTDIAHFCQTGYISALEYQKYKVQGMIKNSLKDFEIELPTVCGSDCHQWNVYPFHDKNAKKIYEEKNLSKDYYFTIKSQPTFKGLLLALTSPKTRFNSCCQASDYIKYFTLNGETYALSNGINAIIGENGSGKTSLILGIASEKLKRDYAYAKDIIKDNDIKSDAETLSNRIKIVHQGELITNDKEHNIFGEEVKFPDINSDAFKKSVDEFIKFILNVIEHNIDKQNKLDDLNSLHFEINLNYDNVDTFYTTITIEKDFTLIKNPYQERIDEIKNIIKSILNETHNNIYNLKDKKNLIKAATYVQLVLNHIYQKYREKNREIKIKNYIKNGIDNYNNTILTLSTDFDTKVSQYKKAKVNFTTKLLSALKASKFKIPKHPIIDVSSGTQSVTRQGFDFRTIANFNKANDIEKELITSIFKSGYTLKSILSFNTEDQIKNSIKNLGAKTWKQKIEESKNSFIEDNVKTRNEVFVSASQTKMGNTLGEKAIVYYKFISHVESKYKIIVIDQPEDNISNKKIITKLRDYFEILRKDHQIIYVTHNPLLVVNVDVDNVICVTNNDNKLSVQTGCLETEGILENIAENMDGGKEAIRKRLKVYE